MAGGIKSMPEEPVLRRDVPNGSSEGPVKRLETSLYTCRGFQFLEKRGFKIHALDHLRMPTSLVGRFKPS